MTTGKVVEGLRAWLHEEAGGEEFAQQIGLYDRFPEFRAGAMLAPGKSSGVPTFSTVREAQEWAKAQGLVEYAYLENVDIGIVQEWMQALADMQRAYNGLSVKAIGTNSQMPANVFALVRRGRNVLLNSKWSADYEQLRAALQKAVESGWIAPGTDSVKGMFDHELMHVVHVGLDLDTNSTLRRLYREALAANSIPGRAAGENYEEFIASCWTSYVNNPSHGLTEQRVGRAIETLMGGAK